MNSAPQPSPQPPSPLRRLLRLTNARLASQAVFLGLFVFFIWAGWTSRLAGFPVSWLLELDPLTALATALSGGTLYRGLGWSLLVVALTFVFGRVFCNWICPFGTLHQLAGWLFNTRGNRERIAQNEYRRRQYLKYSLLVALLVMAALGVLQTGLLDPIATVYRGWALTVAPAADMAAGRLGAPEWMLFAPGVKERVFTGSFWAGLFFLGLLALNIRWPRFFCRVLCPLGALLGVLSRLALFRINRDPALCNGCNVCLTRCEGASDPHSVLRLSECLACMNCLDDCHEGALRYTMLGLDKTQVNPAPDMGRRRLLFAGLGGLLAVPLLKGNGWTDDSNYSPLMIRPPGSLPERSFLARCIKCEQCVNVCPTNVLQPATLAEGGIEALWTPVLRFNIAHCQLKCTLCSEVCPTGAIRHITTAEKMGLGPHRQAGPVRLGTAFLNTTRCLPWANQIPCVVCEEVCPVVPKAIQTREEEVKDVFGKLVVLRKPFIVPDLCIGCGICQAECPVTDRPAVYVTAVGESRSRERALLLSPRRMD